MAEPLAGRAPITGGLGGPRMAGANPAIRSVGVIVQGIAVGIAVYSPVIRVRRLETSGPDAQWPAGRSPQETLHR